MYLKWQQLVYKLTVLLSV